MSEPTEIKIICPQCKRETKMQVGDDFVPTDFEEKNARAHVNDAQPEMNSEFYKDIRKSHENLEPGFMPKKSIMHTHKPGLFKERCSLSEREFKVYWFMWVNHETQKAGMTYHIQDWELSD